MPSGYGSGKSKKLVDDIEGIGFLRNGPGMLQNRGVAGKWCIGTLRGGSAFGVLA
jgi:hypothetical protein